MFVFPPAYQKFVLIERLKLSISLNHGKLFFFSSVRCTEIFYTKLNYYFQANNQYVFRQLNVVDYMSKFFLEKKQNKGFVVRLNSRRSEIKYDEKVKF